MATKKQIPIDEKLEKQDFDVFEALTAIDKKDYGYFDRLTEEQQKKFIPYMLLHWISAIKASKDLQSYYIMSTDYAANKFMFNEAIQKHPKLQWLMLCAASPGLGKQFHQWIPHIKERVSKLKEPAKLKDIKEYFSKIYTSADKELIDEYSQSFVKTHNRKVHLSEIYPNLKLEDLETLNQIISDNDIDEYEKERGN